MNYYEILEISKNASDEVIKNAYRALVKKYHPDKNGNSLITEERMSKINEAYETLIDKEKRAIYDNELLFQEQEEKRLEEEKLYSNIINNKSFNEYEDLEVEENKKSLKEKFEALDEKGKKKAIGISAVIAFFVVFLVTFLITSLATPSTKKEKDTDTEDITEDRFKEDDSYYNESEYDFEDGSDYEINNFHDEDVIEKEENKNTSEEDKEEKENTKTKENSENKEDKENDKTTTKKDNIVTIY